MNKLFSRKHSIFMLIINSILKWRKYSEVLLWQMGDYWERMKDDVFIRKGICDCNGYSKNNQFANYRSIILIFVQIWQ
jgi:hypothetical protein